ncbi:hypothetical protein LCGC14_1489390 [marine sediment metagenome]|uniref:Uncharacterized protein n=1 Tax=marine sediment metagenome TaxID=412755 RepID=A0A0F9M915_9ZZZZ
MGTSISISVYLNNEELDKFIKRRDEITEMARKVVKKEVE